MSYVHQSYPSVRYHRTEPHRVVRDPGEDAALGQGWADSPAAFYDEPSAPLPVESGGVEVPAVPANLGGGIPGAVIEPGVSEVPEGNGDQTDTQAEIEPSRGRKRGGR